MTLWVKSWCGSCSQTAASGNWSRYCQIMRSSMVDLPTPVGPMTWKWRRASISLIPTGRSASIFTGVPLLLPAPFADSFKARRRPLRGYSISASWLPKVGTSAKRPMMTRASPGVTKETGLGFSRRARARVIARPLMS